jgi:antitoxin (DNA-binding transcriptional repressor) of toxin-antitoxin stability system
MKVLGEEACASLERGEAVEIERNGEVVARIDAQRQPAGGPNNAWDRFLALRRLHGPVDEDFEQDLAEARRMLNGPVSSEPWE